MSSVNEKIKDIFRRVDTAANGQNNTNCWSEADINLSAPDGMDYWDWIEQASNEALSEADTLTARVAKLESVLCEISNMCIGNLTMSYSLNADHIGQSIYEATGMSNPELNDSVKEKAGE